VASNTPRLNLYKKDPVADGNDTFNIQTMLNDNWDRIDENVETITGAQAKADQAETNAKAYADQQLATHSADYVKHPGYGVTTGSANAYAVTLNPAPTSYVEGMAISVKINVDNTGPSTININNLGAKAIKKPNGNDVSAGNLKAGSIYTLRYNGTNFILQGEGGGGTAQPAEVLNGKTFTNDSGEQTGTMQNRGAMIITPTTFDQAIPQGYHNGSGIVKGDPDLIASNIRQGVDIFGVVGTLIPGKRMLSGTVTSSSTTSTYTYVNYATGSHYNAEVTGLPFTPSNIILIYDNGSGNYQLTVYSSIDNYIKMAVFGYSSMTNTNYHVRRDTSPAYVNSSGFRLPVFGANTVYSWVAYE
jgi:hypothetical protein